MSAIIFPLCCSAFRCLIFQKLQVFVKYGRFVFRKFQICKIINYDRFLDFLQKKSFLLLLKSWNFRKINRPYFANIARYAHFFVKYPICKILVNFQNLQVFVKYGRFVFRKINYDRFLRKKIIFVVVASWNFRKTNRPYFVNIARFLGKTRKKWAGDSWEKQEKNGPENFFGPGIFNWKFSSAIGDSPVHNRKRNYTTLNLPVNNANISLLPRQDAGQKLRLKGSSASSK